MTTTVGIIANPASGKDIRRLVAHGSVFDNHEKVSIVRRVLLGLDAVDVERVLVMPEAFGIGQRAAHGLGLHLDVQFLDLRPTFTQHDSQRAAAAMADAGVGCIVSLGGDGTNRVVAKGCRSVPLMPISTGTNNVFPTMIEGTIAGLAAGIVARGVANAAVIRAPQIDVLRDDAVIDIALIDAAIYAEQFVGSRAVWDPTKIKELVLSQAMPGNIGLSAIGAQITERTPSGHGLYLRMGTGGHTVLAPIAPGLIEPVAIAEQRVLAPGETVSVCYNQACVLAFDGEREIELHPDETLHLRFNTAGPYVVDARRAIELAASAGAFVVR